MTPYPFTPAALLAAWNALSPAEQQRLLAGHILEREGRSPPQNRLLNRAEAARRMGVSRSSLYLFLRDHHEQIPEHLRPDRQCAVNRISVDFVEWFLKEGHRLPRRKPGRRSGEPTRRPCDR